MKWLPLVEEKPSLWESISSTRCRYARQNRVETNINVTSVLQKCCKNVKLTFCSAFLQIMKLVEVIRIEQTDQIVFDRAFNWVREIGKVPVSCGDTPGFIVNRLLVPALMQAMLMVDRQDASVHDIDVSMQLGAGHPMGPLHLADYIGLDTCLFIVQGWVEKYPNEPAFIIPKCLEEKVAAGNLGRKTGLGFYTWDNDKRGDPSS